MTEEEKEKERFEEWFEREMYILQFSLVPSKSEVDKIVKKWMEEAWLERAKEGEEEIERLKEACRSAITCLADWIRTTGFGAVNKRDSASLKKIEEALKMEVL